MKENSPQELDVPPLTTEELKKALDLERAKLAGDDQVIADMFTDGGQIVLKTGYPVYAMSDSLGRVGILEHCYHNLNP